MNYKHLLCALLLCVSSAQGIVVPDEDPLEAACSWIWPGILCDVLIGDFPMWTASFTGSAAIEAKLRQNYFDRHYSKYMSEKELQFLERRSKNRARSLSRPVFIALLLLSLSAKHWLKVLPTSAPNSSQ